jgi:hypothetical protein
MVMKRFGKVKFTLVSEESKPVPFFLAPNLDLQKEVRRRFWMELWDFFFYSAPDAYGEILGLIDPESARKVKIPSVLYRPDFRLIAEKYPFLNEFQGSILERHLENKQLVAALGYEKFKEAVMTNRQYFPLRYNVT